MWKSSSLQRVTDMRVSSLYFDLAAKQRSNSSSGSTGLRKDSFTLSCEYVLTVNAMCYSHMNDPMEVDLSLMNSATLREENMLLHKYLPCTRMPLSVFGLGLSLLFPVSYIRVTFGMFGTALQMRFLRPRFVCDAFGLSLSLIHI